MARINDAEASSTISSKESGQYVLLPAMRSSSDLSLLAQTIVRRRVQICLLFCERGQGVEWQNRIRGEDAQDDETTMLSSTLQMFSAPSKQDLEIQYVRNAAADRDFELPMAHVVSHIWRRHASM